MNTQIFRGWSYEQRISFFSRLVETFNDDIVQVEKLHDNIVVFTCAVLQLDSTVVQQN